MMIFPFSWYSRSGRHHSRSSSSQQQPRRHHGGGSGGGGSGGNVDTDTRTSRHHPKHQKHDTGRSSRDRRIESEIELLDLDAEISGRRPGIFGTKRSASLGRVASSLRKRYSAASKNAGGRQRIPPDAQIQFYRGDSADTKRLVGDEIPKGLGALWYRVYPRGDGDDDDVGNGASPRVDWDGSNVSLTSAQRRKAELEIEGGATVDAIRQVIVQMLRQSDPESAAHAVKSPLQIEVCAVGGMRPGPLQGGSWVVRRADVWLCRYLRVFLRPFGDYFALRAFNEEYVWHRPELDRQGCAQGRAIKAWLRQEAFAVGPGARGQGSGGTKVHGDDIRLLNSGTVLRERVRVRAGRTLDFDVTRSVEERFVRAEAWLLTATETCCVCSDDKRVSEMPRRITASCTHPVMTCKECVGQWISSSLESMAWNRLKCPECPQLLRFEDVRALAPPHTFDRYDTLATRAAIGAVDEFKWCLNPRCNAGQIFPRGCAKAQCYACKRSLCVHHNVPWHKHETCAEYDHRTRKAKKGEKASAKWIKETTKSCPKCERAVHKYTGCDHVTCICGHEWCWLCLSPHYRDDEGLLQCKHKEECRYFHHPPDYEGGRAFMPFFNFGGGPPPPLGNRRGPPPPPPLFQFPPPPPRAANHQPHDNHHHQQHHHPGFPRHPLGNLDPFRVVFLNEMIGNRAVNHHHVNGNGGDGGPQARPGHRNPFDPGW